LFFEAGHGLLAVRTMGALGAEAPSRVAALEARIPADDRPLVADATDQMNRIRNLADARRAAGAAGGAPGSGGDRSVRARPHRGTNLTDDLSPGHDGPHAAEGHPSHRRSGGRSGALRQRLLS